MKKIKETPSGLLAFGVLVAVALFIWVANKSVIGFVFFVIASIICSLFILVSIDNAN